MKNKIFLIALISMLISSTGFSQVSEITKPLPLTSQTVTKATLLSTDRLQAPEGKMITGFTLSLSDAKIPVQLESSSAAITSDMKNEIKDYIGKEVVLENITLKDDQGKQEKYPAVFITLRK